MKKRSVVCGLWAAMLTMGAVAGWAQNVRLTPYKAPSALYLNAERLFNYNFYEHARFELGMAWVTPNESAEHAKTFLGQWTLDGYAAYGTLDKRMKYGGGVQLRLPGRRDIRISVSAKNDLERAATRRMEEYRMTSVSHNTGYVASRFVAVQAVTGAVTFRPARAWETTLALRYSREQQRFDSVGRLYPTLHPDEAAPFLHFAEGSLRIDYKKNLKVLVTGGTWYDGTPHPYARVLAQFTAGIADSGLYLWSQAGWASHRAPFSRLFDISGTGRTPYFFEHTLLTVAPNRFVAELFAHVCLTYTAPLPLWNTSFSKPKPFLQMNLVWGTAGDQQVAVGGIPVEAPTMGLAEPATGFDGLLRWGILDMGVAVAYQLTLPQAPYRPTSPREGMAFAVVAKLIL